MGMSLTPLPPLDLTYHRSTYNTVPQQVPDVTSHKRDLPHKRIHALGMHSTRTEYGCSIHDRYHA
jgi:hypothetical protein